MASEKQKIDSAIDAFALAMKKRMHEKRLEGFTGWQNIDTEGILDRLKTDALELWKNGDNINPVSVVDCANFAMIIFQNCPLIQEEE